jgi:beta-lactamase regulating signal transducer with metallopeptidase domain
MPDLQSILSVLTSAYGAAVAGLLAALLVRAWICRRPRMPSCAEALWCALLPAAAILTVPVVAMVQPHSANFLVTLHDIWHRWEKAIHASPAAHSTLHMANLLFLILAAFCAARTVFACVRMRAFRASLRAAACRKTSDARCRTSVEPWDRSLQTPTTAIAALAPSEVIPLYLLPSPRPACFTLGFLNPAIYVTSGLVQQLTARDWEAVLAHEAAHVRRRDGLIGSLLAAFYHLFALPGGRILRRDWERAVERECDAEAARRLGSPCDVASALLRVAQLTNQTVPVVPGVSSFAASGEDIEGRVQALLDLGGSDSRRQIPVGSCERYSSALAARLLPLVSKGWLVAVSLGLLCAADLPLRHAVELFVHH